MRASYSSRVGSRKVGAALTDWPFWRVGSTIDGACSSSSLLDMKDEESLVGDAESAAGIAVTGDF